MGGIGVRSSTYLLCSVGRASREESSHWAGGQERAGKTCTAQCQLLLSLPLSPSNSSKGHTGTTRFSQYVLTQIYFQAGGTSKKIIVLWRYAGRFLLAGRLSRAAAGKIPPPAPDTGLHRWWLIILLRPDADEKILLRRTATFEKRLRKSNRLIIQVCHSTTQPF